MNYDCTQVLMFNHSKLETCLDMLDIIKESGLYITASCAIEVEKRMKQSKGNYNCVMLLICRKRNFEYETITKDKLIELLEAYESDIQPFMEDVELSDTDDKIYTWVKAIKILSSYEWDFDLVKTLKEF